MYRRREPDRDKLLNTAAVAPAMPVIRRKRPRPAASSPVPEYSAATIYGVPILAAKIILANCMLWFLALVIVLSPQLDALHLLMALFMLAVGLLIWFGLQWLISRAFWWFVVVYTSTITIVLLVMIVRRILDAMSSVPRI
jgi:hypothetical protein